jgi:CMP/dCMP kinase
LNSASLPSRLLVTVDGPAGAGKSTVSRMLADRLDIRYIDTGALYRAVAWAAAAAGIDSRDDHCLGELCARLDVRFERRDGRTCLLLDHEDMGAAIRTPAITMLASAISARPVVRSFLLQLQRDLGHTGSAVFEGRDMGTVVFPAADVKFFLDANPETRALRRFRELPAGHKPTLEQVREDMRRRDHNDRTRTLAPLKAAADAIHIDSTPMTAAAVVDLMVDHVRRKTS